MTALDTRKITHTTDSWMIIRLNHPNWIDYNNHPTLPPSRVKSQTIAEQPVPHVQDSLWQSYVTHDLDKIQTTSNRPSLHSRPLLPFSPLSHRSQITAWGSACARPSDAESGQERSYCSPRIYYLDVAIRHAQEHYHLNPRHASWPARARYRVIMNSCLTRFLTHESRGTFWWAPYIDYVLVHADRHCHSTRWC